MVKNTEENIYASLKQRIFAKLVDFLIFSAVFFPITYIVKGVWIMSPLDHQWAYGIFITDPLCILFLFIIMAYFILLEAFIGQTIGKLLFGIKVITNDGSNPGLRRSFIRNILHVIDSLPTLYIYGIYLMQKSPVQARFGDVKAGTVVIIQKLKREHKI